MYHSVANHIYSYNQKRSFQVVDTLPPGSIIAFNYRIHGFFPRSGTDFIVESWKLQRSGHGENLKNGTCGLSSLVLGIIGWVQGNSSRAVLP